MYKGRKCPKEMFKALHTQIKLSSLVVNNIHTNVKSMKAKGIHNCSHIYHM